MSSSSRVTKIISAIIMIISVSACGGGGGSDSNSSNSNSNSTSTSTTGTAKAVSEIPSSVPEDSNLSAYIILDGDTSSHFPMSINISADSATAEIPNLSLSAHSIQIVYQYNYGGTNYDVAESSVKSINLSNGSSTLDIQSSDYTTANFDSDSDGLSNAYELVHGTNPGDAGCVVGYSLVGSCTL